MLMPVRCLNFERLDQREVIYVDGSTGSIPKMTLCEDDEVFFYEGSEVFFDKMTVHY